MSLGHLFGAFVALFTGYVASFVVFVVESIIQFEKVFRVGEAGAKPDTGQSGQT